MLSVPPQHAADASLWDLVDATGIVIRQFPAVPPAYEMMGARERSERGRARRAGYATKSGLDAPSGPGAAAAGIEFSGQRLMNLSRDPRARAIGYSVRPSRLTTVKAPGRA